MPLWAGQIITVGQLNRMQPQPFYQQAGSGTNISTTSFVALAGCSVTVTTTAPNAQYTVSANFSFDTITSVASVYTRGGLSVDGVVQSGEARWSEGSSGGDTADYDMSSKAWGGVLAAAGSHTLKLVGALNTASGSPVISSTGFTDITVVIYEVV
ncbi:hypothetical protein [Streptomyces alboviridis]|uniref:hypothetical protein n=1 Tax=Streptomyces alboviridis TaxID=67269 RepID=UPI000515CED4|nr:hypothetical protein [Streptomyces alboviridis]